MHTAVFARGASKKHLTPPPPGRWCFGYLTTPMEVYYWTFGLLAFGLATCTPLLGHLGKVSDTSDVNISEIYLNSAQLCRHASIRAKNLWELFLDHAIRFATDMQVALTAKTKEIFSPYWTSAEGKLCLVVKSTNRSIHRTGDGSYEVLHLASRRRQDFVGTPAVSTCLATGPSSQQLE